MTGDHIAVPQADDNSIADQLIEALRNETGVSDLDYSEWPQRLTGGFETLTYGFSLTSPPETLAGQLILRLFNSAGDINQSRREAAFQNALSSLGYTVPAVHVQLDSAIDGKPVNIMERISGKSLMEGVELGPEDIQRVTVLMAKVHTRLHQVSSGSVIEAVEKAGFSKDQFTYEGRMRYIGRYFEDDTFEALRPVYDWLVENRPDERDEPAVCHGDFHPGNIMINGDEVTGVIDWPGAAFADPEMDVATSVILIRAGAGELEPEVRPMIQQIIDLYLHTYTQINPLDMEKVHYHEVARSFRAFTRGTALLTPGVRPELAPRDHYTWAGEFSMQQLKGRIAEVTGIELPMPVRTR